MPDAVAQDNADKHLLVGGFFRSLYYPKDRKIADEVVRNFFVVN